MSLQFSSLGRYRAEIWQFFRAFCNKIPPGGKEVLRKTSPMRCLLFWLTFQQLLGLGNSKQAPTPNMCSNNHELCGEWARSGECDNNPTWMRPNCMASCNTCPKQFQSQAQFQNQRQFQQMQSQRQSLFFPPPMPQMSPVERPRPFRVCQNRIQTVEIPTRFVPTGLEYRNRAFRMGCAIPNQENNCARNVCYHAFYRTFDGSCNNLMQPMKGAACTPYARLLRAHYEDGINRMIGSTPGTMPNPREVSSQILSSKLAVLTTFNGLLMQYGQFLSHDITRNTIINTCSCSTVSSQCANMPIPRHDAKRGECIPFTRSIPLCGTGATGTGTPRTPMNENSAFIDCSQIYGSDPTTAQTLRSGPLLKTKAVRNLIFPPPSEGSDNIVTGDTRSNLFIGLAAFHTIFVRLHNRIALSFFRLNPHWDEERVYQETRKIIGCISQAITYQEFIPALLGDQAAELIRPYSGHHPEVEPAVSNEFSAAAYRLHGLIRENYRLVDNNFRSVGDVRFVDGTGSIARLLATGTDLLLRGLITVHSKFPQRLTKQVTEELFSLSDMGSLNIQRGRDQGMQTYFAYRKLCGLRTFNSFFDWPEVPNRQVQERVAELYRSPGVVDLYVGGLLEQPVGTSLLGPTFTCIIAEQFIRTRDSDRFFYLNPQMYSPAQIEAFKQVTMAWVLCETGERFDRVPFNAFVVDSGERSIPCNRVPKLDLRLWMEKS